MNIEDALRADGAAEHPNPLAGRGAQLVRAASRRRRERHASVAGVVTAAVVGLAVLVPGPWRGAPVEVDPTDPASSGETGVVAPASVCDLTIDDLLEEPRTDGSPLAIHEAPAGVRVSLQAWPSADGAQIAVAVRITNDGDVPITVREHGNEVWAVDDATGEIRGYWAALDEPPDRVVDPGSSAGIEELITFVPCEGDQLTDGSYWIVARGAAMGGEGREHWIVSGSVVSISGGVVIDRTTPVGQPTSAGPGNPFALGPLWLPWVDWDWPDTGLTVTAAIEPGPYTAAPDAPDDIGAEMTVTNTSAVDITAEVVPWLALLVTYEDGSRYAMSIPDVTGGTAMALGPGESTQVTGSLPLDRILADHLLPGQPPLADGEYEVVVVLLDAAASTVTEAGEDELLAYAVTEPHTVQLSSGWDNPND